MREYIDAMDVAFYLICLGGAGSLALLGYTIYEVYKKSKNEKRQPQKQSQLETQVKGEEK